MLKRLINNRHTHVLFDIIATTLGVITALLIIITTLIMALTFFLFAVLPQSVMPESWTIY